MKRDLHGKIALRYLLPLTTVAAGPTAWAHPGLSGHATANPPAHGMMHAVMNAPALVAAAGLALGGAWLLLRLWRRRHTAVESHREPQLNRE